MRAVGSRERLAGVLASMAAAVLVACGGGSDGSGLPADPSPTSVSAPAEHAGDESVEESGDGSDQGVEQSDEPAFSLPADVWPAEVDTVEVAPTLGKDIVTVAVGVTGDGVQPVGFDTVTAQVTSSDGVVCEICLWLAEAPPDRARGLMGVTDLGDAVGMAFVWDAPTDGRFVMVDTPTPLSIAWFAEDGAFVSETDMEPCLVEDTASCERYAAEGSYTLAIEMFAGQLDAVGIGPGATVEILDLPC